MYYSLFNNLRSDRRSLVSSLVDRRLSGLTTGYSQGEENFSWYGAETIPWGVLNKVLFGGRSAPRSNPLAFYIPFSTEQVRLSYTFYWQMAPLSHTLSSTLHRSLLTDCCKCTVLPAHQNVFSTFSQPKNASGSSFGPFYRPKSHISFHIYLK